VVPRELVEDEHRCERDELVEGRAERMDVMEDAAGDDSVERPWVFELLERDPPVEGPFGSLRVDREHVMTRSRQPGRDAAFLATADLEDAPWGIR
jgi:hypothetical protein